MRIDNPNAQLKALAELAGLTHLFGEVEFDDAGVDALELAGEGEIVEVGFGNADGPIGVMSVDLHDSGNAEDEGLTLGLRGWRLDDGVASVS
jgi:hypothetical protein